MYGKCVKIDPSVAIDDTPLKHNDHTTYDCYDSRCIKDLCECKEDHDSLSSYIDWDNCPFIKQNKKHEHSNRCPECERLVLKETAELFSKALKATENQITINATQGSRESTNASKTII